MRFRLGKKKVKYFRTIFFYLQQDLNTKYFSVFNNTSWPLFFIPYARKVPQFKSVLLSKNMFDRIPEFYTKKDVQPDVLFSARSPDREKKA
jgi:hypothetical protein